MKNYILRKQINEKGCYAEIFYDITIDEHALNGTNITYNADERWETACKAGIIVFIEYFGPYLKGHLDITVYEIKWLPVDTNNLIVFFTTIKAMAEGLSLPSDKIKMELENDCFVFPEIRSI